MIWPPFESELGTNFFTFVIKKSYKYKKQKKCLTTTWLMLFVPCKYFFQITHYDGRSVASSVALCVAIALLLQGESNPQLVARASASKALEYIVPRHPEYFWRNYLCLAFEKRKKKLKPSMPTYARNCVFFLACFCSIQQYESA